MDNARIIKLDLDTTILPFDCADAELNGFLFDDAKNHYKERVATTFLIINDVDTIAYWSYLNDKITVSDLNGNFEIFQQRISAMLGKEIKEKEYKSFPSVKIGRLAVSKKYQKQGWGENVLRFTKELFITNNRTGCRFITVDAFRAAVDFYKKNGFIAMSSRDKKHDTRQMYFDLNRIIV